jgi:hypothetical protein
MLTKKCWKIYKMLTKSIWRNQHFLKMLENIYEKRWEKPPEKCWKKPPEKCWLKNVEKNVGYTLKMFKKMLTPLKKCWKKCSQHFKKYWWKNTDNSSKNYYLKNKKSQSTWVLEELNMLSVLGFVDFIVRLLIHLPVGRKEPH